ncbi:hypothetical protein HU200_016945 [Digitaria exilis]|uniref:Uncharacterized protein n=1 Tax=Digitaria exilis TaxID=1010633 RepID=A0A835KHY3_9POAL|nr:hypothetical protein HU200_016945 [Digitaria exilis]
MGSTLPSASHDPTNDDEACIHAMELLNGFVASMTVKAVIELGLIDDLLAAGGRAVTPEELVAARPWPRPAEAVAAADRMLRFLASHSVVRCTTEVGPDGKARRSYAAAPVCKWLATRKSNGGQGSMAPLALMNMNKAFMETYYMKDAVAEGVTPTEKAYGMPLFEHLSWDKASNMLFNQAMASHSEIVTKKLLELYRGFDGVDVLVDVGGGTGATLQMITARHKHLRGVNYDLPHVIAQAPIVEVVLHLWRDEECIKILENCHSALPANGKVIIIEFVLPSSPETTPAAKGAFNLDVVMLNRLAGAKERTEREIADLAAEAGFSGGCKATYIFACAWALEFTK